VIQHKTYVTPYLRNQVFERGLEQPLHEGRIWRIVKEGAALSPLPKMSTATVEQLVENLSNPNGWWRDTAQRLLVERSEPSSVPLLEKLAESSANPLARLHALWTLSGFDKLGEATIIAGLHDKDPRVCAAAIRLSDPFLSDKDGKMLGEVLALQKRADVRLQFVLSISGVKNDKAEEALCAILAASADQPFIKDAAISGLAGRELDFLQLLLTDPAWEKSSPAKAVVLNGLASAAFREAKPATVAQLLETATLEKGTTHWRQVAILSGITAINKGQSKPGKVKLTAKPEAFLRLTDDSDAVIATLAKAADAFLMWPGKVVVEKHVTPLTTEQKESFARGKVLFTTICAQCHQPDGRGFEGKAPSLRDSPIALGPDIRLIRIVLNGAKGEYHVAGWSPNLEMPTLAILEDAKIADVLTYVRHEWDHDAAPVEEATVAKVRAEVGGRQAAWTEPELLAVPVPQTPTTQPTAAKSK
jgi:mono/diheme cytochrome c family protein